jgi:NAD(P)H-hydrate epimerase
VIAALAGQGLSLFDASVLGVYVHGLAGNIAAAVHGQVSLIATDIIDNLSGAFGQVVEW